jgi:Fur family ferric uptake transcriptional regulator
LKEKPITKMTRQRRVILAALGELGTHPDACEVYEAVRREIPNISLGTVYRNLEVLSAAGLIGRVETTGARKRFDASAEPHYHVRCVKCGRVEDIGASMVSIPVEAISERSGFEIVGKMIEFLGICPDCAGKSHKDGPAERKADGSGSRRGAGR